MIKYLSILALGLTACGTQHYSALSADEQRIADRVAQVRALRSEIAAFWPGFDAPQNDVPLLYYTDSVCYAVNPAPEFLDRFPARLAYRDAGMTIYKTARPDSVAFHMEAHFDFGDSTAFNARIPYLYCSSPEITRSTIPDVTTDSIWMPMLLHEYAHGFQFCQPGMARTFAREMIPGSETEFSRLHKRLEWFDTAIKSENASLRAALATENQAVRDSCIRAFRIQRSERKLRMAAEMGDSTVRAEEIYESMEGMARFVEVRVGVQLGSYSPDQAWINDTDHSGYFFATGYNLICLLDKCGVDKSRIFTEEMRPLETFLTTAN